MSGKVTLCLESPIGPLDVTLSAYAVHRIDFKGVAPSGPVPRPIAPLFKKVAQQLSEYFEGKRREFSLPLEADPAGTDFQRIVWTALSEIPYGEVISYADLSAWAGRPTAVRAAASACGANRIPIVIPCHRVVAKRGLGGYAGGIKIKKALLKIEQGL
jgi:methylated-DNA-[protein]-cysteine S-methyltransferase